MIFIKLNNIIKILKFKSMTVAIEEKEKKALKYFI